MRFFFDYATDGQSIYDYGGDEFNDSAGALDHAGSIVDHLKGSLSRDWVGWRLEVRDSEGKKLFSVPID